MKFLFLSEFFPKSDDDKLTGGSECRTYYLAKELQKRGHVVTVLSSNNVGPKRDYTKGGDLFRRLLFLFALIIAGLRTDFDVVDGNNTAVWLAAYIIGKLKRKKIVYWVPDVLGLSAWVRAVGPVAGFINWVNESLEMLLIPDQVVALSHSTKEKLKKWHIPDEKISLIYPAIPAISSHQRQKMPTIISVNRLVGYKRNDLVIKALPASVKYKVIGPGEQIDNLKRLAKGKNVEFFGSLSNSDVLKHYQKADVFSLPSEIEGFGIVTLEAMSAGLPFVNSDIPVHQEIAAASHAGLLFRSGDAADLNEKIKLLLNDKKLYARLSQNALAFARKHTWDKMAKKYEDLFLN